MLAYQSQAKKDGYWSDKKPYTGRQEGHVEEEQDDVGGEQKEDAGALDGDQAQLVQVDDVVDETPRRQGEIRPRVVIFGEPHDGKE